MVRATAAEVLKLLGGTYPPGTDATNVGNLLANADYILDAYVKKHYKASLSTTDTSILYVANQMAVHLAKRIAYYHAASYLKGIPEPEILTQELKDIIEAYLADTTTDDHAAAIDAIDTSD